MNSFFQRTNDFYKTSVKLIPISNMQLSLRCWSH